jgi:isopentenyldiphosphate isomerase
MATSSNPYALDKAQDDCEVFEVMESPPKNFDMFQDVPPSTGQRKARHLVHKDQDWHRSVHIWVVDTARRQVVMQKRSPHKDTFPNRWDISAAGHIEFGDDSRDTAIRETAEELGIQCSKEELIYGFTCPAEQASLGGCNCYEDVYFVMRDRESLKFAIGQAEVTDVMWIIIDDLKKALNDGDEAFVPRVEIYRNSFFSKLSLLVCS